MSSVLENFVKSEVKRLSKPFPEFGVGDTIAVKHKIRDEKGNERFQSMEGLCIAIKKGGLSSAFTLRKTAHGVSMEKLFRRYSPLIEEIKLIKKGKVRRAKLYYMRERAGKMARVKQDINYVGGTRVSGKHHHEVPNADDVSGNEE